MQEMQLPSSASDIREAGGKGGGIKSSVRLEKGKGVAARASTG